jgi:hypothetical protein
MSLDQIVFYSMAAVVAFLIGLSKGGLGGMLGALATPLMALVMPTIEVIGLILPLMMFADIFAVAFHWRKWNKFLIILLIPGAVIGVTIGTLFITNAPTEALRTLLGIIVLAFTAYKILENRILGALKYEGKNWHGYLAGTITGFSSSLAHTGGPPVSIYLILQDVSPRVFIATSALFFMILNWIKVPYYWYAGLFDLNKLSQIVWILPLIPLGVITGRWMGLRVSKQVFDRIIITLLGIAGIMLIVF